MLTFFAVGLHRGVAARVRGSVVGPALLAVAGIALVLAGFKTDPALSEGPQTWLRHTAATLLLNRGVHPKYVQHMLGHASISITLDRYSHWMPSMGRATAAAAMDAALEAPDEATDEASG